MGIRRTTVVALSMYAAQASVLCTTLVLVLAIITFTPVLFDELIAPLWARVVGVIVYLLVCGAAGLGLGGLFVWIRKIRERNLKTS